MPTVASSATNHFPLVITNPTAQARAAIFKWIEVFCNRERLPSALGFKSLVDFEQQLN